LFDFAFEVYFELQKTSNSGKMYDREEVRIFIVKWKSQSR